MVRPGLKRLQEAQRVKVQPNKTGTSFMQGQSVYLKSGTICNKDDTRNCVQQGILLKNGVKFSSVANTPYNNLSNSKIFKPTYTETEKNEDRCCKNIKQKVFPLNDAGRIIGVTYPTTNLTYPDT